MVREATPNGLGNGGGETDGALRARAVGPDAHSPGTSSGAGGLRPIDDWEIPWLIQFGEELRNFRRLARLTQATLAFRAELAERSLRRIEYGSRRTRLSTLVRLARHISRDVDDVTEDEVLERLMGAAGPALAAESDYAERSSVRRARRQAKKTTQFVTLHQTTYRGMPGGVVERHRHLRRIGRSSLRVTEYQVMRSAGHT